MLRGLVKTGIASALYWSGVGSLLAQHARIRTMPLVIGYHRVVENFRKAVVYSIPPMLISVRTFERQLDWIGRHYDFITLDDLSEWADGNKQFNRPVAAITFDDGYADLYENAYPVLYRKGIPAAVFVVTSKVGTSRLQIYDELYLLLSLAFSRCSDMPDHFLPLLLMMEIPMPALRNIARAAGNPLTATWAMIENLQQHDMRRVIEALRTKVEIPPVARKELGLMDWEMLREMAHNGIAIGSHTCTHVQLTLESHEKAADEVQRSRSDIEQNLNIPVEHFAYPNGAFNSDVVDAVAKAGYRCAYTTCHHRDPRYPNLTIPRRLWWENSCIDIFGRLSPAVMSCQVSGIFDQATAACGQAHTV